jgi:hypothetical protein
MPYGARSSLFGETVGAVAVTAFPGAFPAPLAEIAHYHSFG